MPGTLLFPRIHAQPADRKQLVFPIALLASKLRFQQCRQSVLWPFIFEPIASARRNTGDVYAVPIGNTSNQPDCRNPQWNPGNLLWSVQPGLAVQRTRYSESSDPKPHLRYPTTICLLRGTGGRERKPGGGENRLDRKTDLIQNGKGTN